MSTSVVGTVSDHPDYRRWLQGPLALITAVIVLRFILEVERVPKDITRFVSGSVIGALILIYLGAIAPLRGVTRYRQLWKPAIVWPVWVTVWDTLALVISAAFHLPGSHFADAPGIFQNWQHVGLHILSHIGLILPSILITFGFLAFMFLLHRWPVVVAPSAVLGALVTMRFAAEALNMTPATASAWSSSVGVLLGAFYVGGFGPQWGLASARQLLAPSLALGLVWRFWIFLAALASVPPLYKTHFFDPSGGRVVIRLLEFLGVEVIVVGVIAGLIVWGIASWMARSLKPSFAS